MLEVLCAILESIPYFRAKNLFFLTLFFWKEGINIPAHMYLIILIKWFYILLFKKNRHSKDFILQIFQNCKHLVEMGAILIQ